MAVGVSSTTANAMLDGQFGTVYVALHTANPGAAGTTAASAGDATRKTATMASASAGSKSASASFGPWTNGGTSETISNISLWTAVSAGTFLASATLTASKSWVSTDTFTLTTLSVSITPIAS